ncbi:MAG: DMT family transporter [Thermoplasmata archaeon]|nr:DMT family transporter [Thermoplasmata archaeon]
MDRKIFIYAIVAAMIWGLSFPVTKIGVEITSPILFAFLRYAIASILFFILLLYRNAFHISNLHLFALLGIFGVTLPTIFQNIGLQYTSSYITGFLQSTGPIYTVILAYLFLGEKINAYKITGIFLAFIGIYFMMQPEAGGDLFGNILVLSSAICYSIGGIIAKSLLNRGYEAFSVIAFSSILGTFFLLPAIPFENLRVSHESIKYILFLALFTTFVAYLLWYAAMEKMEISKLSFFTYLIPVFSLLSSHILLNEEIKIAAIIAGFIAVIGVAIAQRA